jgi:hypothetical protein
MTFYSLVLFVHVTAVLTLFAALTFEVLSLFHLRRASTLTEVRLWIDPVPRLPQAAANSLLVVFCSGIYLTIRMSAFGEAWPKVTIAALLFVAPIAAITGTRMRAIRRTCAIGTAINSELRGRLHDPVLKVSLDIRIAVILGIVLLMGAKPELWESVGIVGASLVLGFLPSLLASRRTSSLPVPGGNLGD